jgi:hypothetical protein
VQCVLAFEFRIMRSFWRKHLGLWFLLLVACAEPRVVAVSAALLARSSSERH